jgi:hypothetical protein
MSSDAEEDILSLYDYNLSHIVLRMLKTTSVVRVVLNIPLAQLYSGVSG